MENNLYYSPEKSGFSTFADLDTADSYEFDIFLILKRDSDNRLFYVTDSGCSCPTPFEWVEIKDLNEITPDTLHNFELALKYHQNISIDDVLSITKRVKDHIKSFYN
jgi:hypothetical protein